MNSIIATEDSKIVNCLTSGISRFDGTWLHTPRVTFKSITELMRNFENEVDFIFVEIPNATDDCHELLRMLRSTTAAIIVAIGSVTSPRQIVEIIRSGANDFMDRDEDLYKELLQILKRSLQTDGEKCTTIAVTSCSGGCGASSTAANIAAYLATTFGRCGLVDLKMRGGDLAMLLDMSPKHTIADLLAKADSLESGMVEKALASHESGIDLLAAPNLFANLSLARPHAVKHILEFMRRTHQHLVVELEDVHHRDQIGTLCESDHIVLVFRPDLPSFMRTRKLIEFILSSGIDDSRIVLVSNRIGKHSLMDARKLEQAFAPHRVIRVPDDPVVMPKAVNCGKPVVLMAPTSASSRAFVRLASGIVGVSASETKKARGSILRSAVTRVFN